MNEEISIRLFIVEIIAMPSLKYHIILGENQILMKSAYFELLLKFAILSYLYLFMFQSYLFLISYFNSNSSL